MNIELFPPPSPVFASTRKDALDQLDAFIPAAGRYADHRNHVLPGHTNVSRLSPAIRHRLILESECAAAPLQRYAASTIEKIFAGWWIHIEKLPWQLGADFFYRHLLDGDPASNILSWRWVAGLQTPGKTYLPRRSNLEKYLPSEVLAMHHEGLELLDQPQALIPPAETRPNITRPSLPTTPPLREGRLGIWIHEEDLLPEQSPLAALKPSTMLATGDTASWTRFRYPESKINWLQTALTDAANCAGTAFGTETRVSFDSSITETLLRWAAEHQVQQIAAMRPEIGPLHDQIHRLQTELSNDGIDLILFDRPEDLVLRPLATGASLASGRRCRNHSKRKSHKFFLMRLLKRSSGLQSVLYSNYFGLKSKTTFGESMWARRPRSLRRLTYSWICDDACASFVAHVGIKPL